VKAATARQTSNGSNPASDWDQGYGYQFWRCRHGAYRGDGAFGQYCIVLPEQDAVIAITSGVRDMQAVLNLIWTKLMPAFHSTALPTDEVAAKELNHVLKGLSLRMPEARSTAPTAAAKKYVFAANDRKIEAIRIEEGKNALSLVFQVDGKERKIACGGDSWTKGRVAWGRLTEQPAAARAVWIDGQTLLAKVCFVETPFVLTLRLTYGDDQVKCESALNVGFGPGKETPLVGK
jgi:hypothetical protein